MNSLVSIVTPCYNAEKFIAETIKSVQEQTYAYWEMIIVDDNSIDDSVSIIKKIQKNDDRIKLIELKENKGPAIARNRAIKEAQGNYIAFLDSDDTWLFDKLKKQLEFMKNHHVALTFTSYYTNSENKKKCVEAKEKITYSDLLYRNYLGCLTVMYDVDKIGKMYFPEFRKRQDWAMWLNITKKGVIAYGIKEPLAIYNLRKNSLSNNKLDLLKYNWQIYRENEKFGVLKSLYLISILIFKKITS